MKYLIFLTFLCSLTFLAFAEGGNSITDAANTNQILLQNGTTSETNWNTTNGNKPPTSLQIFGNGGSSTTTTSSTNLTDQERELSQNYEDQVGANKILKERCAGDVKVGALELKVGDLQEACAGKAPSKVMGISPGLMKAATQAYATMGVMGDFLSLSKNVETPKTGDAAAKSTTGTDAATTEAPKTTNAEPKADTEKKKEKTDDYCKYIPTVTETAASFAQKNTIANLNNQGGETSQKEAMLKVSASHKERAQQAVIQEAGWYAGAACYVYMASFGQAVVDTSLVVKLGAATFLGTYYELEREANEEYAKQTKNIADALPGKGACNPITQNDCYCAQKENANDPQYCKVQMAKRAATVFTRTACTDSSMRLDPSCSCEKTNSCFEKYLDNHGLADLQMGMGYTNSPFKSIASIAHGRLDGSNITSADYAGTAAIAKKALREMSSTFKFNNNPLTAAQKSAADIIAAQGIPNNIARLMAQNAPPQSAIDKVAGKFNGAGAAYQVASYAPSGRSNVIDFSGGDGLGLGGKKGDKKGGGADDFLGKMNPKGAPISNAKVLEFAQKAQAKAPQITKSDKPIFEIISIRYQTSGRRLLQLDSSQ